MQTKIRVTGDGSHTLYVPEIDECYHSAHGAVQESMHIFINAGLHVFLSAGKPGRFEADAGTMKEKDRVKVLETGFGTGLNVYLTLSEAERLKTAIHYTSLELYPLAADEALRLNYPEILHADRRLFEKIHLSPWEEDVDITPYFTLRKVKVDFIAYEPMEVFDVVYFDAFSPEKQPELWSEDGFGKIYAHSGSGAVLTTYCAKGAVRRVLQSAGFVVERLPGPPGKREILRGRK
ncbi:MAG: tRNA (5-methylaminomethyl-2-thiouridine)(34)-methyltransferase MnmD [Tannerella sp.]|jgi:tRNA U34 5-methylaminomethyl-2-thiouridine-forming methyltransferase MnmC|nr:tRNA (5-methylaminomethyl-2-thiouridine)(34)-methyltransferase MnmD [Tannerella sp.]